MSKKVIIMDGKIVEVLAPNIEATAYGVLKTIPDYIDQWIDSNYVIGDDGEISPSSIDYLRHQIKQKVSAIKREFNTTKTIEIDGHYLVVDAEIQFLVVSIFSALKDGLIDTVNFKFLDGFGVYDKTTFKNVAKAVVSEMQRLFEVENRHYTEIESIDDLRLLYEYDYRKYW